jgi:hypothetical protein
MEFKVIDILYQNCDSVATWLNELAIPGDGELYGWLPMFAINDGSRIVLGRKRK